MNRNKQHRNEERFSLGSQDRSFQQNFGQDEYLDESGSSIQNRDYPREAQSHKKTFENFRGIGPKGYTRADELIEEEVNNTLMRSPYIDASEIEVKVKDGVVQLSGSVEDRNSRFDAEMEIERITGVKDIENNIKVKKLNEYSSRSSHVSKNESNYYS